MWIIYIYIQYNLIYACVYIYICICLLIYLYIYLLFFIQSLIPAPMMAKITLEGYYEEQMDCNHTVILLEKDVWGPVPGIHCRTERL